MVGLGDSTTKPSNNRHTRDDERNQRSSWSLGIRPLPVISSSQIKPVSDHDVIS